MRYEGAMYRPPSEGRSLILQATVGCSHNLCTYCAMYREKAFRVRPVAESLKDLETAAAHYGAGVEKLFVADGDALVLPMGHWEAILQRARNLFPRLRQVSCYATAGNVLEKGQADMTRLGEMGLNLLYLGPESGDPKTLKRLVKGATAQDHIDAAALARTAGMKTSVIILLGAGGIERTEEHAQASAKLVTGMDPDYLSALTLTVVPGTPLAKLETRGRFKVPAVDGLLGELRTIVAESRPTNTLFRTNHASNYLPLGGRLPGDRDRILRTLDAAISGQVPLRPEWSRGL